MRDSDPSKQIDLERREYRAEPRKGEPIMAPGGWLVLVGVAGVALYYYVGARVLGPLIEPAVQWVMSFFR